MSERFSSFLVIHKVGCFYIAYVVKRKIQVDDFLCVVTSSEDLIWDLLRSTMMTS